MVPKTEGKQSKVRTTAASGLQGTPTAAIALQPQGSAVAAKTTEISRMPCDS